MSSNKKRSRGSENDDWNCNYNEPSFKKRRVSDCNWACTICTYINGVNNAQCEMCEHKRNHNGNNGNGNNHIMHHWIPLNDDRKEDDNNNNNGTYCIAVVGTTGVGKSSLIKLFCGNNVHTSSGKKSDTKHCTIYSEIGNNRNRKWMDTQGTDDTDMKDDDEGVLKKAFKELHDKKICNIKLIWIISGDMDRERGEFKKQAKFINCFINDINRKNEIWKSCLIIHKKGKLSPSLNSIKGAISAANSYGSNINYEYESKYLFGFSCLDWMTDKDVADDGHLKDIKLLASDIQSTRLLQNGYLNEDKVKEYVNKKLNALPTLKLEFLNEKCTKCGAKGDHRYIKAKCHQNKIKVHPGNLLNYHSNGLISYHPNSSFVHVSSRGTSIRHSNNKKHKSGEEALKGAKWGAIAGPLGAGIGAGIGAIFGSQKSYHVCDNGCVTQYNCCGSTRQSGCSYSCCQLRKGSNKGCQQKYSCCNMPNGSTASGCKQKYSCCGNDKNSIGCTNACDFCQKKWGTNAGCKAVSFMKN